MPSSCGMFVYRDVTSAVTKRVLGGRGGSFCFMKFMLRSIGGIKFVILFQDSDTGGSSSITIRMEYLFVLQF